MYEVKEKKARKVPFRDFTMPMKAKSVMTPQGKLLVVGGEKVLSDASIRFSREITLFDQRFCMMKVAALMREGRTYHSLVASQEASGK
jgi:hypothetical protein